ncbi:MAG TPA: toll/interleukin-1 receptor domain-containing protein [Rudaea sp.]
MNSPADSPRYFAFISYSHQDELWAQWLHKTLETWRVPNRLVGQPTDAGIIPSRLLPIFRDREELASATDLGRTVNAALAQSKNLIVICSPASAKSRWVNEEVLAFKRLGHAESIFCLIVGGEPNASDLAGREAEECFAPALRFQMGADGQSTGQRTEPIAADAREGKDGKANAKLKLIAGLLDVGFDTLKQREQQRRNRRLAVLSAIAVIVMLVTTTLAIMAMIARGDAERRQKQAEDLVGFMLGDLNDKLGEVHRLDILQAVDDKAMAYFASLPTKDVTDATLAQRVTALEKIGGVRLDQGQIPAGLEAYNAASTLAAELVQRVPGDMMRQAAYADSLKWVGQAYWYRGDLDEALQRFKSASAILQRVFAVRSDDNELAFQLAAARNNVGHVLELRGDFAGALTEYEATRSIYEELGRREPGNSRWKSRLGDAYNNLGKLALQHGQIDQAIGAYRADQRIKAKLAASDPGNHDGQENLLVSNAILGRTLGLCGEIDAATQYTKDAVESARGLMSFDGTNADWQEYYALYSQQLGGLLRQKKRYEDAAIADADAVRVLDVLKNKDETRVDLRQELAQSQLESARLLLSRGEVEAAENLVNAARSAIEALRVKNADSRALILLAAQASTLFGEVAARRHEAGRARDHWLAARDTIGVAASTGEDPNFLAELASALLLLDDINQAKPVIGKLAAMGYRTPDFVALVESRQLAYPDNADVSQRIAEAMK